MRSMILLIIGCLILALGVFLGIREHLWLKQANTADGKVVELIRSRGSKGKTNYKPRVTYRTPDGQEHTFTRGYASSPPGFKVGEKVLVAYHPSTNEGRILSFGQRFGAALIIAALGCAFTITVLGYKLGGKLVPEIYIRQHSSQPRW